MKRTLFWAAMTALVMASLTANANTITFFSGNAPIGQPDPQVIGYGAMPLQQAVVIDRAHPLWVSPIPGTNWVSLRSDGYGPVGDYYWETTFVLPSHYANPSITVSYYCDDFGYNWLLNGNACGGHSSFQTGQMDTSTASETAFFRPGENTLAFVVYNQQAWTGVDYYATVSYDSVPEPSSALAFLCGLGGLVPVLRRQGFRSSKGSEGEEHAL